MDKFESRLNMSIPEFRALEGKNRSSTIDAPVAIGSASTSDSHAEPALSRTQALFEERASTANTQAACSSTVVWADPNRLLRIIDSREKAPAVSPWTFQWHQNLGLLMNVYQRTQNPEIKRLIGFLVCNYLGKSAPISMLTLSDDAATQNLLSQCIQLSPIDRGPMYNRETNAFDEYFDKTICRECALESGDDFFSLDAKDIAQALATISNLAGSQKDDVTTLQEWTRAIIEFLRQHQTKHSQQPAAHWARFSLLIDMTTLLESTIHTDRNPAKEKEFNQAFHHAETLLNRAIDQAILSEEWKGVPPQELRVWIIANVTCICRCDVRSVSVLKILPALQNPQQFLIPQGISPLMEGRETIPEKAALKLLESKRTKSRVDLEQILNSTGIRLGSVNGRRKIFDFLSLEQFIRHISNGLLVDYDGSGEKWFYCRDKIDPVSTGLFRRMECFFDPENPEKGILAQSKPYLRVLGGSTLKLFKGLLREMSEEQWQALNHHPDLQKIVQAALYKIHVHLANAEGCLEDFSKFSHLMELIHYEMATLITLITPFREGDFFAIFKERLQEVIPGELRDYVQAGISKSGMNTFAGINAALQRIHPQPVRAIHPSVHFEMLQCFGKNEELSKVLQNRELTHVDLFLGGMNPNVQLISAHDCYSAENIIQEITALLEAKPATQQLTVALDGTIDFIRSQKAHEILHHFSLEIRSGRLNFVFFRSGQKFDMFGMDHFYGSPWFMVNNRASYWEPFQLLASHEAFKADPLSMQWFCLSHRYAFPELEMYRGLIFENTKEILRHVPKSLLPGANPQVKICLVAERTEPCFLDVKCYGDYATPLARRIEGRMYQLFTERGLKMYFRGGYGYLHPNSVMFQGGFDQSKYERNYVTLRIHPGINREENGLIIQLLEEIPQLDASFLKQR